MKIKNQLIQAEEMFLDQHMPIADIAKAMNLTDKQVKALLQYSLK